MDRQVALEELHLNQRSGVVDRKGAEYYRVQHLVDCSIGSDAERQGEDRRSGEGGIAAELPERVCHVLREAVEDRKAALVAIGFVKLSDGSEVAARFGTGVGWGESAALVVGREKGEMGGDFGIEFGVCAPLSGKAGKQDAQGCHAWFSRRRAIMATVRLQFSVSAASCLRPARVME